MNTSNWMSAVDDTVKLTDIVMPGSHNAGCRRMIPLAECQSGDLAEQAACGVRYFDIRLDTHRRRTVFAHSMIMGVPIEGDLAALRFFLERSPSEFLIIEIRGYGDDSFGPYTHKCRVDTAQTGEILEHYLECSRYALTDFESIADVTMGDIRRSGKRFLLLNEKEEFPYSKSCDFVSPWSSERHGRKAETFAGRATEVFDQTEKKGIFVLQSQQTGGFGTETGLASPKKLNRAFGAYFDIIIENIRRNPLYLQKANVILGDYWLDNPDRVCKVLSLNTDKGNINQYMTEEFNKML